MNTSTYRLAFFFGFVVISCFSFSTNIGRDYRTEPKYVRNQSVASLAKTLTRRVNQHTLRAGRYLTAKYISRIVSSANYSKIDVGVKSNTSANTQRNASTSLVYTTGSTVTTSAGVYDGDILIRTLWSNEKREAGSYDLSNVWDGKDDKGEYVVDKKYTIQVTSGNVKYDWLRPIGNTSDSLSGPSVHNTGQSIMNMVQVNNTMYVARGYNEGGDAHGRL